MDRTEPVFTHLFKLTSYLLDQLRHLLVITNKEQLRIFITILEDLIKAITHTLDNLRSWNSGKNRIDHLLSKRLEFLKYKTILFDNFENRSTQNVITTYNFNKNAFFQQLEELLDLFV